VLCITVFWIHIQIFVEIKSVLILAVVDVEIPATVQNRGPYQPLDDPGSNPGKSNIPFSFVKHQTGSGPHTTFYVIGTGCSLPRTKVTELHHLVQTLECVELYIHGVHWNNFQWQWKQYLAQLINTLKPQQSFYPKQCYAISHINECHYTQTNVKHFLTEQISSSAHIRPQSLRNIQEGRLKRHTHVSQFVVTTCQRKLLPEHQRLTNKAFRQLFTATNRHSSRLYTNAIWRPIRDLRWSELLIRGCC